MASFVLPDVPAKHADFIPYIKSHSSTPLIELLEPYKQYDATLREIFAQEPEHSSLSDEHLNVVPVFDGHEQDLRIRARDLESEIDEEKEKYLMPLNVNDRRPNNSPAIVETIKDFQQNFTLFCESSLVDLNWDNVVAAGSSVVTCLLPVPEEHKSSKRVLRTYYHETVAPASDIDLFLYGLSEEDAIKKITEIERQIKDSILTETTTIRTKNAITIASQYPTRHIQIVLRIYKSVSEILTGFDVDCSCAAYDGTQVWASPRALAAYMSQTNTIDLTRRSPSYESRLSKYSRRGFEVYWPLLERSRVDPTIFERNFARTLGLARLLVLERLPTKSEREAYMDERRQERGRPAINRYRNYGMRDNIKDRYDDEIAEWVNQEDVSDYHTFTIPYGPKYHAKKIEKLLYTKDLLLNAEWNKPKDREVNLHRHPAFFGYAEDVIHDCCGFCPKPITPEEHEVADEEGKVYVSGEISFIRDDAGRQAIGSFHPITDDDWTEMAYIGNTTRLCQAIVDQDLEHVLDWLSQEGVDPNCRDYTGRTPLHLAVISSSPEIVKALIDHGARLVARLADGRTALHLAAARGNVEMVRLIMQKSEENEEEEAKKETSRKEAQATATESKDSNTQAPAATNGQEDEDIEMIDQDDLSSDDEARTTTTGGFIKVKEEEKKSDDLIPEESEDEPDIYDVNVLAWDTQCSPLHLAILNGHIDVVRELVQSFGADALLPVKLLNTHDRSPRGAILTLVLSLKLPLEKAKAMTRTLLELGASSAQADTNQTTALHYVSTQEPALVDTLLEVDEPAAKRVINHLSVSGSSWRPTSHSPLMSAIAQGNAAAALKLLEIGAETAITFESWVKSVQAQFEDIGRNDSMRNREIFDHDVEQPIILAAQNELPEIVLHLLEMGVDQNTLTRLTRESLTRSWNYHAMESLLDLVRSKIKQFQDFETNNQPRSVRRVIFEDGIDYLAGIEPGTYKYFTAQVQIDRARREEKQSTAISSYAEQMRKYYLALEEKKIEVKAMAKRFEELEKVLVSKGAKTFQELHPDRGSGETYQNYRGYTSPQPKPFEVCFDFPVPDQTDTIRDVYIKLFQAAWDGDLKVIKDLTLAPWSESAQTPLKISTQDRHGHTVFTIAVLRGHWDLARALVEICYAQFEPEKEEESKTRYRLAETDGSDDEDGDSNNVPVFEEIVDDKFTIENIGELSTQVKSKVSPIAFISWTSATWEYKNFCQPDKVITCGIDNREVKSTEHSTLLSWSLITNDKALFNFLLELEIQWTDLLAKKLDNSVGIPSFSGFDFDLAIQYGRVELLAEMIKHSGVGIELQSFVKKSGVKLQEKPKYYQGLSVHGKKRPAWINAARGTYKEDVSDSSPPLLLAAFKGSLQSVEWFMSDSPARYYLDFAEAYKHDKLIDHLNKNAGGFEKLLRKWLATRNELALHCAVMAEPRPETTKLVKYLVEAMPESLETKSSDGHTPLALAFALKRWEAAKVLIEAGADQSVRDFDGCNILHLLLCPSQGGTYIADEKVLPKLLNLIDERLVPSICTEKTSLEPGSLTPIARWMHNANENATEVLQVLLKFTSSTNYEFLELLDGSGDTPLHHIVKKGRRTWLKAILECRPDLLYRENSVGRTPYELAEDTYLSGCVQHAPNVVNNRHHQSIANHHIHYNHDSTSKSVIKEDTWCICREFGDKTSGKRKLVSLLDANEVANRLAKRQKQKRYRRVRYSEENDGEEAETDPETVDEIRNWFHSAYSFKYDTHSL